MPYQQKIQLSMWAYLYGSWEDGELNATWNEKSVYITICVFYGIGWRICKSDFCKMLKGAIPDRE